jgi:hypothetical protein
MSCCEIHAKFRCDYKGCENTFQSESFVTTWSNLNEESGYDIEEDERPNGWVTYTVSPHFTETKHLCPEHACKKSELKNR